MILPVDNGARQTRPLWSPHVLLFQRANLKMGYKRLRKRRSKLMKQLRQTIPRHAHIVWNTHQDLPPSAVFPNHGNLSLQSMTIVTPKPLTVPGTPDSQPSPDQELLSLSNTFIPLEEKDKDKPKLSSLLSCQTHLITAIVIVTVV